MHFYYIKSYARSKRIKIKRQNCKKDENGENIRKTNNKLSRRFWW